MDGVKESTRRSHIVVVAIVACVVHLNMLFHKNKSYISSIISEKDSKRDVVRKELMYRIETDERIHGVLRMGPTTFMKFVILSREKSFLKDIIYSSIEEQFAKFLYVVGQNESTRSMGFIFLRSGETISRHFHNILKAIISLQDQFIIQPDGNEVPPEIFHNHRFYQYFKDCVEHVARYRGRKDFQTQNVLASCTFDLRFTYVLPGWEGSAADGRVLEDALEREDKLKVPNGISSYIY
ncbi:uncharacterized protein [Primulina huaijiensis]|uniref:uncharacterized protein n=1 Tax=Primulina huaijiensis TaxID=1492673 RepID=UPI003CC768F6